MDDRNQIIIEFITKTQGLAYQNNFGVCIFCGGGQMKNDKDGLWAPLHADECLYSRAYTAMAKSDIIKQDWQ